jgi:hypothetical protein
LHKARKRAFEVDSPTSKDPETPAPRKNIRLTGEFESEPRSEREERTITYDEVYQGGKARHKHAMFQSPLGEPGKWYIVKCEAEDHTVHFGGPERALHGAAKHLSGKYHQLSRSHRNAIELLGWEVLGCDAEKAEANNLAMEKALSHGYVPVNMKFPLTATGATPRRSIGGAASPRERGSPPGPGITRPKDGHLYYAWWPRDSKYYLCMVLPWGDTDSYGLPELYRGIAGLGLLDEKDVDLPECYKYDDDSEPSVIVGWSEGYEDGGPLEAQRLFPVLFFHPP